MTGAECDTNVLVIGAGPTGLTFVHELKRHGVDCKIVDKSPNPSVYSKALAIHARTLEVFHGMGIIKEVLEKGQKIHGANIFIDGNKIAHLSFDDLDSPYPYTISLPQSETELILLEHLSGNGLYVERGKELVSIRQENEIVYSTIKALDGSLTVLKSKYVVACDGAHSGARHALDLGFEGTRYPEAFVLADMTAETELSESEVYLFNTESGLLALFPFGNKRWRMVADVPLDHKLFQVEKVGQPEDEQIAVTAKRDPEFEDVQELMNNRCPVPFQLTKPDWVASFAIHCRQMSAYRHERVFFAGDAAHIHSPAGGQGMNTGIQDAYNLAWKMALVLKGVAKDKILRSYDAERHAVAESVLKTTDFLTKVNTMRNPIARSIRNRLAPYLVNHESVQRKAQQNLSELSVNYRKSPIVAEHKVNFVVAEVQRKKHSELPDFSEWCDFNAGPAAGDRASNAAFMTADGSRQVQLFDLLAGTQHHLLLFAGARSELDGITALGEAASFVVQNYDQWIKVHNFASHNDIWKDLPELGDRYVDSDLSLHHRYGAATECLYLVRPDGYIAFRSMPAERDQLKRYIETVFETPAI